MLNNIILVFLAYLLLTISGCAGIKPAHDDRFFVPDFEIECKSQEDGGCQWPHGLETRFAKYWDMRFSGEYQESLLMEAPYIQYVVVPEKYEIYAKGMKDLRLDKIEIHSVNKITENMVIISMRLIFVDSSGKNKFNSRRDRWLLIDNEWFHVVRNPLVFPEISRQ